MKFLTLKEDSQEVIKVRDFEEVVKVAKIIYFNESRIEIPGIVIFAKEKKGFMLQLMNPGVEIFQVSDEDFENMTNLLKVRDEGSLYLKTKTVPASEVKVNIDLIKKDLVIFRKTDNFVVLNNFLFTTSEVEFQGSGMFSGKESFYVDQETFKELSKIID